jgi:hypothetical protein
MHQHCRDSQKIGAWRLQGSQVEVSMQFRDGDKNGDEKERRYRAMKKSSLRAQKRNRTV